MLDIDKDSFEQEVLKSDIPVLVEFWGEQCSDCLAIMPEVEALAESYKGRVKFCKIAIAGNRRLCIEFKVLSVPTFFFYRCGEQMGRLANAEVSAENIRAKIEAMLQQA